VPGTRVFRVMLRMRIHPGMEKSFERNWYEGSSVITEQPDNLGQWLSADAEEQGVYYILSDWTDEPGFRAYESSEQHRTHRARLHPFRAEGSMTTMHVVHEMPANGPR
jgi:heme-degrading monooxygenase HmoA